MHEEDEEYNTFTLKKSKDGKYLALIFREGMDYAHLIGYTETTSLKRASQVIKGRYAKYPLNQSHDIIDLEKSKALQYNMNFDTLVQQTIVVSDVGKFSAQTSFYYGNIPCEIIDKVKELS